MSLASNRNSRTSLSLFAVASRSLPSRTRNLRPGDAIISVHCDCLIRYCGQHKDPPSSTASLGFAGRWAVSLLPTATSSDIVGRRVFHTDNTFNFINRCTHDLSVVLTPTYKGVCRRIAFGGLISRPSVLDKIEESLPMEDLMVREGHGAYVPPNPGGNHDRRE